MASITRLLDIIKNGVYGKDIRQAIHDALEQNYVDANSNININKELEDARGEYDTLGDRLDSIEGSSKQNDDYDDIVSLEEKTYVPGKENIIIKAGTYLKGDQIILGDPNLESENILRGDYNQNQISIFGVRGSLDRVRTFNTYLGGSGYYGIQVADCARSYHLARINGSAQFRYSQVKGIMGNGILTDEEGRCYMDCSSFVGLVLRGIPFKSSPYYDVKGIANATLESLNKTKRIVSELCETSKYTWSDIYLDRQVNETLTNSFKDNYRSIRTAAQIAEYHYGQGHTLYEFNKSPTTIPKGLLPGDLLFWAKSGASEYQKSRFKAISHVGIVARNCINYYHCTGYSDERVTNTLFCSKIENHLDELVLIIRPNYNPVLVPKTPNNVNLLPEYVWDGLNISPSYTSNGVEVTALTDGGFKVKRVAASNEGKTFYLYKYDKPVTLTKGTYKLSGCPSYSSKGELYWGLSIRKASDRSDILDSITGKRIWDSGSGCIFTLDKDIDVYVYFYMSDECTDTKEYTIKPSLVKTDGAVSYKKVADDNTSGKIPEPGGTGENNAETIGTIKVIVKTLNVRSAPGTVSNLLGQVYLDDVLEVVDKDSSTGWFKIKYNGSYAWVTNKSTYILVLTGDIITDNNQGNDNGTGTVQLSDLRNKILERARSIVKDCNDGKAWYSQKCRTYNYDKPVKITVHSETVLGETYNQPGYGKIGYDCSSFVGVCYQNAGITYLMNKSCSGGTLQSTLNTNSSKMWRYIDQTSLEELKPGDIIIKAKDGQKVTDSNMASVATRHTMIFAGLSNREGYVYTLEAANYSKGIVYQERKMTELMFFARIPELTNSDNGTSSTVTSIEEYINCYLETGMINGKNYIYKLSNARCTAYGSTSNSSACSIPLSIGATCGSLNLPYGTRIYVPMMDGKKIVDGNGKTVMCDGIFTVNDTGVGCTDFDLFLSTYSGNDAAKILGNPIRSDVYVLNFGSGKGYAWSYTESYAWAYKNGVLNNYKTAFKNYISNEGVLINFLKFKENDKDIRNSDYWKILKG